MKWTVLWKARAEADLANLWTSASDKADITAAANRIDVRLRKDPLHTGDPRASDDRVYFDPPLGILFTVAEMDRTVWVERVWRMAPDSKNGKP
ncbi:MAG: hypothetical protein HY289_10715 [Planctomycetes bacterium]|nr:hypothetical protein [Planctomycetota bacterium]